MEQWEKADQWGKQEVEGGESWGWGREVGIIGEQAVALDGGGGGFTMLYNHCRMLEEFDREVEHTDSRMRSLTARVNKAIKKTGSKFESVVYACAIDHCFFSSLPHR